MLHKVIPSSFSVCLKSSPEFLQISISHSDVISLAVSEVRPPRKLMPLFSPSLGVTLCESIALHLTVAYDERQIAICNDDYKFAVFSHSILQKFAVFNEAISVSL